MYIGNKVWHSRPLDVHRVSDHSEFNSLVALVLDSSSELVNYLSIPSRTKKSKSDGFKVFKALLLDLYVCWLEDKNQWLGISSNNNAWNTGSRYNKLFISKNIVRLLQKLESLGLLNVLPHRHSDIDRPHLNHSKRYRASDKLQALFLQSNLSFDDVGVPLREVIVLRGGDIDATGDANGKSTTLEYEDTPVTVAMRADVMAYNSLLAKHHIDIGSLTKPHVEIDYWDKNRRVNAKINIMIGQHNKYVYRVFSRGSWDCHGRFYGAWWMRIPKASRADIVIDGCPTIEVDFKSMHIHLLAQETGVLLPPDPYSLNRVYIEGLKLSEQRRWVKALVLHCINAKTLASAFRAFRSDAGGDKLMRAVTDKQLKLLLDGFLAHHPSLQPHMGSDRGITLMRKDSDIAAEVIRLLTLQGIPVLTVHDSFIVKSFHWVDLRCAMGMASIRVAGRDLLADQDGLVADREQGYETYALGALKLNYWGRQCEMSSRRQELFKRFAGRAVVTGLGSRRSSEG